LDKRQHIFQKSNHLFKVLVLDILNSTSSDLSVKTHFSLSLHMETQFSQLRSHM